MAETQDELHNRLAGQIIASIVRPPLEAGGDYRNCLVLLESVIAGTIHVLAKLGGDEIVLDHVMAAVKERMAQLRLCDLQPKGSA